MGSIKFSGPLSSSSDGSPNLTGQKSGSGDLQKPFYGGSDRPREAHLAAAVPAVPVSPRGINVYDRSGQITRTGISGGGGGGDISPFKAFNSSSGN